MNARAQVLFKFKALLEQHFEELARIVTTEHGKTLDESRGSVRRGIECVEVACGAPSLHAWATASRTSRRASTATSCASRSASARRSRRSTFRRWCRCGFCRSPSSTGNTFVLKPSEQVPLSQRLMIDLLQQCDLPPGVVNLVNGGREVVDAICDHPGIRAVSFVGSTPVARHVYQRATNAGKRVQALGGAKNFVVVMPDARSGAVDRHHHRVVLRLRGRALPGGQHAGAGRRRARRDARPHGGVRARR